MMNDSKQDIQIQTLTTRGDRLIIENIDEGPFHERAKVLRQEAERQGLALGVVYHTPIRTGIIFVK